MERPSFVCLGLIDEQQRIFLLRTLRFPDFWQPPGGGVEPFDADSMAAVLREMREETGLMLQAEDLHLSLVLPADVRGDTIHFYTTTITSARAATMVMQREELAEWRWVPLAETAALPAMHATETFLAHMREQHASVRT